MFSLPLKNVQKFRALLGFKGNKVEGLRLLNKCYRQNSLRSLHAALLIVLYRICFAKDISHSASDILAEYLTAQDSYSASPGKLFTMISAACLLYHDFLPKVALEAIDAAIELSSQ